MVVNSSVKISSIFVAFLENINFTQTDLMKDFYYFFQGEEYFAHRLWKIVVLEFIHGVFFKKKAAI